METQVVRYFSENHNPVDILIINGDNRAIVTKIAKFDDSGKMSHCEWTLADHRSFKEFHSILVKSTDKNAMELFTAIGQVNENPTRIVCGHEVVRTFLPSETQK